jgi:3-deoxy-D-arabino-heptulosonate 7-phosphate (DAHP) synthase
MRDAKVKKHKKKRTKSDTVFDGDTGRKFPEKPEHSKDMRGEKVKKHKKKRTKSDKVLDGDSGRVIVIIAPPSKAVKILKSEQKHNFWKHVQRRRRIRPE